jgi:hypothetical protein
MILCALAASLAVQTCAVEPVATETMELPLAFAPIEAAAERPISLVVTDFDGRPEVWLLATRQLSRDVAFDAYLQAAPDRRSPDMALGVSLRISLGGLGVSSRR